MNNTSISDKDPSLIVRHDSQKDHQMDVNIVTKCPDQDEDIPNSTLHQQSQGDDHSRESSQQWTVDEQRNKANDIDDDSK